MRITVLALLLAAATTASATEPPLLDTAAMAARAFGNDAPWYQRNIPFLDTPDQRLARVYNYRWQILRSHIRDIGAQGTVFTEFLPEVSWDRKPYSTLNDSAPFPILEGRWMRDPRPVDSFIDYLYADAGNDRHFSESLADAAWQRYRVTGDPAPLLRNLGGMRYVFNAWTTTTTRARACTGSSRWRMRRSTRSPPSTPAAARTASPAAWRSGRRSTRS